MKYLFLNEVISEKITGDWGDEGDKVNVLRTTNFTNDGVIDYSNVVTRDIPEKVIERKKLVQGDVIIEKSGGSPSQPVGRVVYFERKEEVFLCNNFTAILRSNDLVFSKYLFYFLFSLHRLGITLKFQNKTTGIINLQLDKYLGRIQIPLPPLPEQKRIAEILDKADALRLKNKQLLYAYDELLQATFLDMFGDPVTNPKGWKKSKISNLISNIDSGWSPNCDSLPRKNSVDWAILTLSSVSGRYYKEFFNKNLPQVQTPRESIEVKKGDLLFSRKNTRDLVGACAFVFETSPRLIMPDTIFRIKYKSEVLNGIYAFYLLNSINFRVNIQKLATGSSGSMPNISKEKLKNLFVPLPPINLQNQFAQIVENIEAQKALVKQSLHESEDLFNGLVQKAFSGEL